MPDNMDGSRRLYEQMESSESDEEAEDESDTEGMWDHEEVEDVEVEQAGGKKPSASRSAVHFDRTVKDTNGKRIKKTEARKEKNTTSRTRRGMDGKRTEADGRTITRWMRGASAAIGIRGALLGNT